MVLPTGGDLQCPFARLLTDHILQVGLGELGSWLLGALCHRQFPLTRQPATQLQQTIAGVYLSRGDEARFGPIGRW